MKNIKKGYITASAVLLTSLFSANVFATNPYGIEYTGGEILGAENVQINANLVENLTPLIKTGEDTEVVAFDSDRIEEGYLLAGSGGNRCQAVKYVTVSNETPATMDDEIGFQLTQGQALLTVIIKNIVLESVSNEKVYAVGIGEDENNLYVGYRIYEDSSCETVNSDINYLGQNSSERIFVDMLLDVVENSNVNPRVKSARTIDNLYFALTDIDRAQSYKILNEGNELTKSRMYALSAEGLQSQRGNDLRNMYVEDGNYIYSEYNSDGSGLSSLNLLDTANIYTKIGSKAQEDGLNVVLGFVTHAYNGFEFYTSPDSDEFAQITYDSDEYGTITGEESEDIEVGESPNGSSSKANTGYVFAYWVADVDVELKDGTTIAAGDPITDDQVKDIVVTENISLTAVHTLAEPSDDDDDDDTPVVPNTGASTGSTNATIVTVSVIGILLGALFIRLLPLLTHKKLDFNK